MTTARLTEPLVIPHREISAEEHAFYQREGYVLLRGVLSPAQAEQLREEVMEIMEIIGLGVSKLRQTHEYYKGSALDQFVHSATLNAIASQLMGGPSTVYLPFTAVKSGGGGGRFHFHQDNQYTRHDGPSCNLWHALSPMTRENGCLQIVPRSHLEGTLESEASGDGDSHRKVKWEPSDFVEILMEPGDCVAFTRLTVHGSGPNNTTENRVAYAVQFHRDDTRWLDGETWKSLKTERRWCDIHGVDIITPPQGKRDGH